MKYPILILDMRFWDKYEINSFLEDKASLFSEERVETSPFRIVIIINDENEYLLEDVNAKVIVQTDDAEKQNRYIEVAKFLDEGNDSKDLIGKNVFWRFFPQDFDGIMPIIKSLEGFIKETESFNIVVNIDNIDYSTLKNKNKADLINIYQKIQGINPNLVRNNINLIFELPSEITNINQIVTITNLLNISGVVLNREQTQEVEF